MSVLIMIASLLTACQECLCDMQVHRLGMPDLRQAMRSGNMLLPSVTTAYLAIEELQQRGYSI